MRTVILLALLLIAPAARAETIDRDWRRVASDFDRDRLRGWRDAWLQAVAEARAGGHDEELAQLGALADPDAVIDGAMPPAGEYRCRVVKLGSRPGNGRSYFAGPAGRCRIETDGDQLSFYRVDGIQRPVGLIWPDKAARAIFLGTLIIGDEQRPLDYGRDRGRDMAGLVQRIGPKAWRLVLPYPRFESLLDIVELTPMS